MTITEKAKEKLDEAGKEIKAAIDGLSQEIAGLSEKARRRLQGGGEEMKQAAETLSREVKELSEKVKQLMPKGRLRDRWPVRRPKEREYYPEAADFIPAEFRREFNRLWNDFLTRFESPSNIRKGHSAPAWDATGSLWPQIDVAETEENILITAELPGVDKDDVEISIDRNRITIRGEKKAEEKKKGLGYYHMERFYGTFNRSLSLPWEVDPDAVEAEFKKGVLKVSLPKSAAARQHTRKIAVQTE